VRVIKQYWFFILTFVIILVLFFQVFSTFFTGDDFFHFKVSQTNGSLISFVKLFGFYPFGQRGIAFYRPIFREALYNIFYTIFGLNAYPFRILQICIHLTNIVLVYFVFLKLIKNKFVSIFTSFFFGISAANVGSLFYLAGGIQAQGALLFTLLSLISFLNRKRLLSFVFFLLALSSHEISICLPLLLAGTIYLEEKNIKKFVIQSIRELWVYGLVLILYLYMNFFVIGFSSGESAYRISFNPKTIINTLSWYISWSLGLPEMFLDFLLSGFKLNPDLMKNFGNYYRLIFPTFFASVVFIFLFIVKSIKSFFRDKIVIFLVAWFVLGLLPVLFLPVHKQTYYLQVSLPAFLGLIGYLMYKAKLRRSISGIFILVLIILNITSVQLANVTYWAKLRGQVALKLLENIKSQYPNLPKGSTIYVKNDPSYPFISSDWGGASKQAYFILNGNDGLQLLYKDNSLKVYYEDLSKKINTPYEFIARLQ
jgi:hypothetical protein